jgi:hypothetical protein
MVNDPSNASSPENQVKRVGPLVATEKMVNNPSNAKAAAEKSRRVDGSR